MIGTNFTRRYCGSYRKQETSAVVEVLVPSKHLTHDRRSAASVLTIFRARDTPASTVPLDSLGKRLKSPLPRLSRLEKSYGERKTGPRLRNTRHVDLESAPT